MGQRGFRFSSEVKTKYIVIAAFIVLALLAVYIVYGNPNRSSFGLYDGRSPYKVKLTNNSDYYIKVVITHRLHDIRFGLIERLSMNIGETKEFNFTELTRLRIIPEGPLIGGNMRLDIPDVNYTISSDLSRTELNYLTVNSANNKVTLTTPSPPLSKPIIYEKNQPKKNKKK